MQLVRRHVSRPPDNERAVSVVNSNLDQNIHNHIDRYRYNHFHRNKDLVRIAVNKFLLDILGNSVLTNISIVIWRSRA